MRIFAAGLLLALATVSSPVKGAVEPPDPVTTRDTMDRIFEAVSELLPLSLDEARFADPASRPRIEAALQVLARSSTQLEQHSQLRSEGFEYLSRSLSGDVTVIQAHYEAERYAEARFLLNVLTETCMACHSRLPSSHDFQLSDQLLSRSELEILSPKETARLQVAMRQFGAALDTYEAIFEDPSMPPAQMDLGGHFVDYLTVSIRVLADYARPIPVLERLARRPDTTTYLRRHVEGWVRALEDLRSREQPPAGIEDARKLIDKARDASEFPSDRDGLVYDLAASGVLHRYVESAAPGSPARAEAYYLLGVAESRSRHNYWLSETEHYLETAIRLSPRSPYARKAYALLEEFTIFGYTGSAGTSVPPEVQAKLDELRELAYAP
jgi:hypothetical protein